MAPGPAPTERSSPPSQPHRVPPKPGKAPGPGAPLPWKRGLTRCRWLRSVGGQEHRFRDDGGAESTRQADAPISPLPPPQPAWGEQLENGQASIRLKLRDWHRDQSKLRGGLASSERSRSAQFRPQKISIRLSHAHASQGRRQQRDGS